MTDKVIIACTITVTGDSQKNNLLPCIADSVYEAWKAGAAICRLCINDGSGNILLNQNQLEKTIRLIREKECDVILACDSFGEASLEDRAGAAIFEAIEGIEIGTCTIGTFNYDGVSTVYNVPGYLKELMTTLKNRKIKPECRVLDMGMMGNMKWLIKSGYVSEPLFCQIAMGIVGGVDDDVDSLLHTVRNLPEGTIWSALAGTDSQMEIIYSSLVLGGHISINLAANGTETDVSMIERAIVAIKEYSKKAVTADEAREILGLN